MWPGTSPNSLFSRGFSSSSLRMESWKRVLKTVLLWGHSGVVLQAGRRHQGKKAEFWFSSRSEGNSHLDSWCEVGEDCSHARVLWALCPWSKNNTDLRFTAEIFGCHTAPRKTIATQRKPGGLQWCICFLEIWRQDNPITMLAGSHLSFQCCWAASKAFRFQLC